MSDATNLELNETPIVDAALATARLARNAAKRRTFAIISHPDAGKTTLTEKLLLFGQGAQERALRHLGLVGGGKAARHFRG